MPGRVGLCVGGLSTTFALGPKPFPSPITRSCVASPILRRRLCLAGPVAAAILVVMTVKETRARSILTRTRIPGIDYCLNPYTGCSHACRYCYATFMTKYSGHDEPWGTWVDAKVNAPELLKKALRRARTGEVVLSSVTDPYQSAEKRYRLTRTCLELLAMSSLRVSILTKSDLVTRDIDILKTMQNVEVGLTVTTDDEQIRRIFEPGSASIARRIAALKALKQAGIPRYVFIGPVLPMDAEHLAAMIAPLADHVLIDRLNYAWKVRPVYETHGLNHALDPSFFEAAETRLIEGLNRHGIPVRLV